MKKILGYTILLIVFTAIFSAMVYDGGIRLALITMGISLALIGLIVLACFLIS